MIDKGLNRFYEYCREHIEFYERFSDNLTITPTRLDNLPSEYYGVFRTKNNIYEMRYDKTHCRFGVAKFKKEDEIVWECILCE